MDTFVFLFDLTFFVFLTVFVVLLTVTVVFHLKCRVPFVPTPRRVIRAMLDAVDLKDGQLVLDLGAGDGRVLSAAKRRCRGIRAVGYEGAIGVWMLARIRSWFLRDGVDVRRENFLQVDLSDADVIFLYLCIDPIRLLTPKFLRELVPGTRVVSHAFSLPGIEPDFVRDVPMQFGGKTKVFVYLWK
ncbi:MAG: class I SAM-dependent methyltransferase [Candidatus Peribacteraceae bacterium]|nr:class I SAM-dependent methyltransferase [Candidatus Peribacteraceae bacterium]